MIRELLDNTAQGNTIWRSTDEGVLEFYTVLDDVVISLRKEANTPKLFLDNIRCRVRDTDLLRPLWDEVKNKEDEFIQRQLNDKLRRVRQVLERF